MSIVPVSEGFINTKVTYGSDWAEIVQFEEPLFVGTLPGERARTGNRGNVKGGPVDCSDTERRERDQANKERSIKRSRQTVRHKVKEMSANNPAVYMWTLTYAENMQDWDKAVRDWEIFCKKLKRCVSGDFQYIAVKERQKRGAWHYHVIASIWIDQRELTAIWGHGHVWIKKCHDARHACRYVLKYMTKVFDETDKGQNRYCCSQGIGVNKAYFQVAEGVDIRDLLDFLGIVSTLECDGWFEPVGIVWTSYGKTNDDCSSQGQGLA